MHVYNARYGLCFEMWTGIGGPMIDCKFIYYLPTYNLHIPSVKSYLFSALKGYSGFYHNANIF